MHSFGRALIAAAGIFALPAGAFAADAVVPAYQVSPAPNASGPLTNSGLPIATNLFSSTSLGNAAEFSSTRNALNWPAGNGINVQLGAAGLDRSSFGNPVDPFTYRQTSSSAINSALNWNFANWGSAQFTTSAVQDRSLLLGSASSKSLGLSASLGLGEGWVGSISYSENQLELKPISAVAQDLNRSSYGVAIAKHGLFGDDALGLLLSHPASNRNAATALDGVGASTIPSLYVRDRLLDKPADADIELGYVTSFLDGAVALQTNASYQMNFDSKKPDSVSLLSRAKIKF